MVKYKVINRDKIGRLMVPSKLTARMPKNLFINSTDGMIEIVPKSTVGLKIRAARDGRLRIPAKVSSKITGDLIIGYRKDSTIIIRSISLT